MSGADWDEAVLAGGGHFLQSWRWGEFKSRFGWELERVSVSSGSRVALAQLLFQQRGPVSVGYVPRGPVLPDDDPELTRALLHQIDATSGSGARSIPWWNWIGRFRYRVGTSNMALCSVRTTFSPRELSRCRCFLTINS